MSSFFEKKSAQSLQERQEYYQRAFSWALDKHYLETQKENERKEKKKISDQEWEVCDLITDPEEKKKREKANKIQTREDIIVQHLMKHRKREFERVSRYFEVNLLMHRLSATHYDFRAKYVTFIPILLCTTLVSIFGLVGTIFESGNVPGAEYDRRFLFDGKNSFIENIRNIEANFNRILFEGIGENGDLGRPFGEMTNEDNNRRILTDLSTKNLVEIFKESNIGTQVLFEEIRENICVDIDIPFEELTGNNVNGRNLQVTENTTDDIKDDSGENFPVDNPSIENTDDVGSEFGITHGLLTIQRENQSAFVMSLIAGILGLIATMLASCGKYSNYQSKADMHVSAVQTLNHICDTLKINEILLDRTKGNKYYTALKELRHEKMKLGDNIEDADDTYGGIRVHNGPVAGCDIEAHKQAFKTMKESCIYPIPTRLETAFKDLYWEFRPAPLEVRTYIYPRLYHALRHHIADYWYFPLFLPKIDIQKFCVNEMGEEYDYYFQKKRWNDKRKERSEEGWIFDRMDIVMEDDSEELLKMKENLTSAMADLDKKLKETASKETAEDTLRKENEELRKRLEKAQKSSEKDSLEVDQGNEDAANDGEGSVTPISEETEDIVDNDDVPSNQANAIV